jgi:hypothetical protein
MADAEDDQNKPAANGAGDDAKSGKDSPGADAKGRDFRALLISGMLAIVTTAAAQGIKAYLDGSLETSKFHFSLIEKALQSDSTQARIESLNFLTDINLITDKALAHGVRCYLKNHPESVPQFLPANTTGGSTQKYVASFKGELLTTHPDLAGKDLAVVGLMVRDGDIVNGFAPIYAEISNDPAQHRLKISDTHIPGEFHGESNGNEEYMVKNSGLVTELDVYSGKYYGSDAVAKLTLIWRGIAKSGYDLDTSPEPFTKTYGSANRLENSNLTLTTYRAPAGCYLADIRKVATETHTSGEVFLLPKFDVTYRPLPHALKGEKMANCGDPGDAPRIPGAGDAATPLATASTSSAADTTAKKIAIDEPDCPVPRPASALNP